MPILLSMVRQDTLMSAYVVWTLALLQATPILFPLYHLETLAVLGWYLECHRGDNTPCQEEVVYELADVAFEMWVVALFDLQLPSQ